jgi:hypothetical protein
MDVAIYISDCVLPTHYRNRCTTFQVYPSVQDPNVISANVATASVIRVSVTLLLLKLTVQFKETFVFWDSNIVKIGQVFQERK